MAIIRIKIDVLKISKAHLYKGEKGTYCDITLLENKNGEDQYGNSWMVVQDLGKEARERGEKGPILGNGKYVGQKPVSYPAPSRDPQTPAIKAMDDEDIPW